MIKILNSKEKQEILDNLKSRFGIEKLNGAIAKIGEEKLFLFSGSLTEKEIRQLEAIAFVERIGVYFAKIIGNEVKLSIEGVFLLKSQIKKNIFELNKEQVSDWMKGQDLNLVSGKKGFIIMKYGNDFLGSGKASENKIGNFITKSRRVKK